MLGTKLIIVISLYLLLETQESKCMEPLLPISESLSTWPTSRSRSTLNSIKLPMDQPYGYICPQPNGYYPVSRRCDAYIECKDNMPIQYKCPYGLYYSPNTQWPNFPCNYPWMETENGRCSRPFVDRPQLPPAPRNRFRSPPTTLPRTLLNPTNNPENQLYGYNCLESNGYHPISTRCDAYIECKDYRATQYKCPDGLFYASNIQWPKFPCNYPWLVFQNGRCGGTPIRTTPAPPTDMFTAESTMTTPTPQSDPPNTSTTNLIIVYPENYQPITTTSEPLSIQPSTQFWEPCWQNLGMDPKCPTARATVDTFESPNKSFLTEIKTLPWYSDGEVAPITSPTLAPMSELLVGITAEPIESTLAPAVALELTTSAISLESTRHPPKELLNYNCQKGNGFHSVSTICEAYVECKNHTAIQYECPNGLHYDPNIQWPDFPCNYPSKVQCENITENDNSMLTPECPQSYGYFPMNGSSDCAKYIMCKDGRAIIMDCPTGLAFNFNKSSCDWPVNVPGCTPNAFKDFTCPPPPSDSDGNAIFKYRYEETCNRYVACQNGRPRLLSCDAGLSFDEKTESCVDSKLVLNCVA